jgi:hypothetical protein
MSEMIAAGVEAILIKVAGIGLQERHLGKTLAQMEPTFHKLVSALQTCNGLTLLTAGSMTHMVLIYAARVASTRLSH